MANPGKRYSAANEKIDRSKRYELAEALELARSLAGTKFNETVEVAVKLGVDPRKSDQMVRGSVVLPRGLGKSVRVLVFAKGEKEKEARDAGAEHVGGEDMAAKIGEGWLDFDSVVATPDMMAVVGKLGKILGPRGLMPNPKSGSVSFDVARMVRDTKAGKVDFRVDKAGIIHAPLGKADFDASALLENAGALLESIQRLRPASAKGAYIRSMSISTTMGPGGSTTVATAAKEKKVVEIRARFENARGAILADFRGLTVSEITVLRRALKANQAEMQVVKNRLVRLAIQDTPFSILDKEFQGPTAVTFCDGEMIEPARELSKFAAAHPALEIKCGMFDGNLMDGSEVERIAKLPPREVLLAQLFGTLQGPITGLVRALNGILVNLVMTLSAIRDQKSGS